MSIVTTTEGYPAKLRRSGMNGVSALTARRQSASEREYMPPLRSLADSATRVAINMAFLAELG